MVESKLGWGGIDFNNEIVGANVGDLGIPMINPKTTIKGKKGVELSQPCRARKLSGRDLRQPAKEWTILLWIPRQDYYGLGRKCQVHQDSDWSH